MCVFVCVTLERYDKFVWFFFLKKYALTSDTDYAYTIFHTLNALQKMSALYANRI